MNDFANRLKELRIEEKLSQQELADKLGLARSSVSMYEQGRREPDFETLEVIADYFNVDIDYLCGRTDERRLVTVVDTDLMAKVMKNYDDYSFIIENFSRLSPEGKKSVRDYVDWMVLKEKGTP